MELTVVVVELLGGQPVQEWFPSPQSWLQQRTAPRDGTVPRRRLAALHGIDTELVAFLEDTSRPDPGWAAAVREAFAADPRLAAAGGPIEPSPSLTPRDRGLVGFDFGPFLDPGYTGSDLPGNALCFRTAPLRDALARSDGLRRTEVLPALRARGWSTRFIREAVVRYERADAVSVSPVSQFQQGRAWAGRAREAGAMGPAAALARAVGWPGVAAVRFARAARAGGSGRALFSAAVLSLAWGAGEAAGVLGGPGRGEESWR